MFTRTFFDFVVLGAVLIMICHGTELSTDESEAKSFLTRISSELFRIMEETTDLKFSPIYNVQIQAIMSEAADYKKIYREAKKFDYENFKDEDLKFAFKMIIKAIDLKNIKRRRFSELFEASEELLRLKRNEEIEDFYNSSVTRIYSPDIENIINTSQHNQELEYYWYSWKRSIEKWASNNFEIYLKAFKAAAKLNGVSPVDFFMRGYNFTEMEIVMAEIKPLYLNLHAFVRNLLREKYGELAISEKGLIPIQLYEQIMVQITSNESIIDDIYPFHTLPPIELALKNLTAEELVKTAEGFYENLGFEKYPPSIWGDRIKLQMYDADDEDNEYEEEEEEDYKFYDNEESGKEDDVCYSVYGFETPNIRLEYCDKFNFDDLLDIYAMLGYLHYSKEMQKAALPGYFFKPAQDLEQPIGDAVILSASTYQNLKEIGLIDSDFNITQEVEINRLMRMAISRILDIPIQFVHVKLMVDLLSETIKQREFNSHYWHLMESYVGVGTPKIDDDPEDSEFDMPFNFFQKLSGNEMSIDFNTYFLTYQMYKTLCELKESTPKEELYLCNLNNSTQAGDALKKMMQLGSSKPYKEVLATMFPDNQNLKADALLEYYDPIMKYLDEKNKETKVEVGWNRTIPEED